MLGDAGIAELSPAPLLRLLPAPPWWILLCPGAVRPEDLWRWATASRSVSLTSRALLGQRVEEKLLEPDRLPLGQNGWDRLTRCPCGTCGERLRALEGLDRAEVGPWAASVDCPPRKFREWAQSHQGALPVVVAWRYIEAVASLEKAEGRSLEAVAASLGYSSAESFRRARTRRGRGRRPRSAEGGGNEV